MTADPDLRLLVRAEALLRSAETVNAAAWAAVTSSRGETLVQLRAALLEYDRVVLEDATHDSPFSNEAWVEEP